MSSPTYFFFFLGNSKFGMNRDSTTPTLLAIQGGSVSSDAAQSLLVRTVSLLFLRALRKTYVRSFDKLILTSDHSPALENKRAAWRTRQDDESLYSFHVAELTFPCDPCSRVSFGSSRTSTLREERFCSWLPQFRNFGAENVYILKPQALLASRVRPRFKNSQDGEYMRGYKSIQPQSDKDSRQTNIDTTPSSNFLQFNSDGGYENLPELP